VISTDGSCAAQAPRRRGCAPATASGAWRWQGPGRSALSCRDLRVARAPEPWPHDVPPGKRIAHGYRARVTVTPLDPTVERALDLAGVVAFALSGAQLGAQKRFDVVGIAALATATALGGGMARDVLLGDVPPVALRDQTYLVLPLVAAAVVLVGHRALARIHRPVLVFDAGGLALFSVVGAAKALDRDLGAVAAVLLGVLTAVGGGVLRDILAREVPSVFKPDSALSAIPAALGGVAIAVLWPRDAVDGTTAALTVAAVFAVRLLAVRFRWRAPTVRP
jgi:uncharacterized membrane protein YeiH